MTPICAPKHHFPQITSVYKIFACNVVRSIEERFAVERMAAQGLSRKKITEAVGVPLSTTKRWLQRLRSERDTASRSVRCEEAGLCFVFHSNPTELRALFNPRVSQNVDRQPWDVRENGQCLGPQAQGARCRDRRLF